MNKLNKGMVLAIMFATAPFMASAACEEQDAANNGGWGYDPVLEEGCFFGEVAQGNNNVATTTATSTESTDATESTSVASHFTAGHRSIKANGLWVIRPMGSVANNMSPVEEAVKNFIFTKNLYFGIRNADVTELQERLTTEGVYTGPVTGYFGTLTRAAAIDYQAAHDITPLRGYVGPITRKALNTTSVDTSVEVAALLKKVELLKKRIANL